MSSQTSQIYTFEYLPQKVGQFTIPPFVIKTKDGTFESDSVSIRVEQNNQKSSQTRSQQIINPMSMFFDSPGEIILMWSIPEREFIQNTGFVADLYLYVENPKFLEKIESALREEVRATFDGGVLHSAPLPTQKNPVVKNSGFRTFYGKIIRSYVGFPLDTGLLNLHTPVFIIDQGPFSGYLQGEIKKIKSKALTQNLSYIGNSLLIDLSLSLKEMQISEENTLTLTIKGDGNVNYFANPFQGKQFKNLFISEPKSELDFSIDENRNLKNVKKILIYKIIPKRSDIYTIPSVSLSYYNFSNKAKTAKSQEISFRVFGQKIEDATENFERFDNVNKIYNISKGTPFLLFGLLLSLIILFSAYLYRRKNYILLNQAHLVRASRAKRRLFEILSNSKKAFEASEYKKSAQLLRQSILHFCRDKFMLSETTSLQEILNFLERNKILFDEKEFISLLNALDFHAFAQQPSKMEMKTYLERSEKLLEELSKIKIKVTKT